MGFVALLVYPLLHCVLFHLALRFFAESLPVAPGPTVSYEETCEQARREGRNYSYFNVNWAQVLRTRLHGHDESKGNASACYKESACIPYMKGKAHLLAAN